ncbi:hypothetical protein B7755_039885 [Streptomyces sp. NBS 14/10]|uniref:hypothetical protein n=1 Tax=Streptomyces sp. NBS 14/10 TaxID=1945643 RepID=UPI00269EF853|nr:hypothetical protein [Streptomyces sp. NBS 14/10]KAK1183756.1 hypothetical protein B7755_039885 [Streptomyces sp. NBS 14/10]
MTGAPDESPAGPPTPKPPTPKPPHDHSAAGARGGRVCRRGGRGVGGIARTAASGLLISLACLLVPVSLVSVWLHDVLLDTGRYMATVSPLAKDPAIQDAALRHVRQALNARRSGRDLTSDIASWLRRQGVSPKAADAVQGLGLRLDPAVDQALTRVAAHVVRGDQFPAVWVGANRAGHNALVHVLTGEGHGAVGVDGETVTLDVGAAVKKVKRQLRHVGLSSASAIPDVDRRMVLFHSDQLGRVRFGARLLDLAGVWLPGLTALLGTSGVLLARRRRRALARAALATAVTSLALGAGLAVARRYWLDHLPPSVLPRAAAAAVYDTLLRGLWTTVRTAGVLGLAVALGAYLAGPGRLPRAARKGADRGADAAARWSAARGLRTGRVGAWAAGHRRGLTFGVLLPTAAAFGVWNRPTAATVLLLTLVPLAALAAIALLAATGRVPRPRAARPRAPTGRGGR